MLQQSGIYVFGQMLQRAISILLIPVWTAYLTPADYGISGTMNAYSTVIHIILMCGLYGAATRHYFEYKEDIASQRSFVTTYLLFLLIMPGAVLAGIACFGEGGWKHVAEAIPFHPYVILMLGSVYLGTLYRLPYTLFQAQQKAKKCILLDLGAFACGVGFTLLFVVGMRKGVYGMMLAGCLAQIPFTTIALALLCREWFTFRLSARAAWKHLRSALRYGLPFVPHLLSGWVLGVIDRVMLAKMAPLSEVGLYTFGYNLSVVMNIFALSFNDAYQPFYFKLLTSDAKPERKVVRIFCLYLTAFGAIGLIGSFFAKEALMIITPPKFQDSARYIPPVLMGFFFEGVYMIVTSPVFYHKKTKLLPLFTGMVALINAVLNYFLIPSYGATAAAWNTLACFVILALLYYSVSQRIQHFPYPFAKMILVFCMIVLGTVVAGRLPAATLAGDAAKAGLVAFYVLACYILLRRELRVDGPDPAV